MDGGERHYEIAQQAERLVGHIESELRYDEVGKSYIIKSSILALVFKVAEFMRHLSKLI
jgi:hypothetical protein